MRPRQSPLKKKSTNKRDYVGEKAKMAVFVEEQRQNKAALEIQRLNSEKGKQQKNAQSSRG